MMKYAYSLIIVVAFLSIISCVSSILEKVDNTDNLTIKLAIARDMIAQTRFTLAQEIFNRIKEQNPTDAALAVTINYELGFILLKKKHYEEAAQHFNELIASYDNFSNNSKIPQWPYYLSKKLLNDTITPVLDKRRLRKEKKTKNKQKLSQE